MKYEGYFLNKYMQKERPKTVNEWSKFLGIHISCVKRRIRDKQLIKVIYSPETFDFIHNFELSKQKIKKYNVVGN